MGPRAQLNRAPRTFSAIVFAIQAALVVLDITTDGEIAFTTAYLTGPLALALVARPRIVAISAVVSLGLAIASGGWNDFFGTGDHAVRCCVVAAAGVLAVLAARARVFAVAAGAQADEAHRTAESGRVLVEQMLGALAEAVTVHDADGKTIYANDAALRLLGVSQQEVASSTPGQLAERFQVTYEDGSPVDVHDYPGRRAVRGEEGASLLTRTIDRTTGRAYWFVTKATAVRTDDGQTLAVNVIEDVTAAKEQERRQAYLAELGRTLAFSLDAGGALEAVARLSVPVLADRCELELLDDPEAEGVPAGGAELSEDRSTIRAALRVGDSTIGVLQLFSFDRTYDDEDVAFADDLALRVAVAVDNIRLSAERAQAAATLQRSLLPSEMPVFRGLDAAAIYQPGERGSEVGGDFYDLFAIPGGAMVVLGDVTGKGVRAAALTAQVRHTARTAARFDPDPASVLGVVDAVLCEQPVLSLVSVVCARLIEEPEGLRLQIVSGGHPLPLLLEEGRASEVGRGGRLLGAAAGGSWPVTEVTLRPGQSVLFYTDGATDVPGDDGRFGEERLRDVASGGPVEPGVVVARIESAIELYRRGRVTDDRALLAIQCVGVALRARRRGR